jgi:hypothetical protein
MSGRIPQLIYEFPAESEPIRQGDIFVRMPKVGLSLRTLQVIDPEGVTSSANWAEIAKAGSPVSLGAGLTPVTAIVATQDCDAVRAPEIVLCEIKTFPEVEASAKDKTSPKRLANLITQQSKINQKWFYLPPDPKIGFDTKMAADFRLTLRVLRDDIEMFKSLRVGRLNALAEAHFRERLGEFFRRYPYDERYNLSADEFQEYNKDRGGVVKPFPWQVKS